MFFQSQRPLSRPGQKLRQNSDMKNPKTFSHYITSYEHEQMNTNKIL